MIKTGLIGGGYWGKKIEVKLDELSDKKFVQTSKNYDPERFPDVEWVFIATPLHTHYKITRDCIMKGVNVFVEKPFCSTLSEAKELLMLAAKYNVHLYVDDVFLHRSELVHRKQPETKSIKFIWHKDGPFNDSLTNDLLYHDLYILISIIGFRSVSDLKSYFNEKDILAFEFYYGDCQVQIDYDRTRKGVKQKTIYLDDMVIHFLNGYEDPLKVIISDCLNQQADFKLNHELNLETMHLMEIITTKLEDQL